MAIERFLDARMRGVTTLGGARPDIAEGKQP
jgi:hypothetical protein